MRCLWHALRSIHAVAMLLLCSWPSTSTASERFDVYVVAVGSSHYAGTSEAEVRGLNPISGANKSAREVAERLLRGGARGGVLLTSDPRGLVSTEDVESAIERTAEQILRDGSDRPLLVFYFAGHGVSEGVGWNHFSLPGTFLFSGRLSDQTVEGLASAGLPASKIVEKLDRTGARYMIVLDTCYEGQPAEFDTPVLSGPAVESLKAIADILRFVNEFRQENPVLYAVAPGALARTVQDPFRPNSTVVAPIARRLMIVLDRAERDAVSLTLADVVRELGSPALDPMTMPVVSHAVPGEEWRRPLVDYAHTSQRPAADSLVQLVGSATAGRICCNPSDVVTATEQATVLDGKVVFSGGSGDFITDGGVIEYSGALTVTQQGRQAIVLSFENLDASWELAFAAPEGEILEQASYIGAVRYFFANPGQPSASITGAGRACNESDSSFTIGKIEFDLEGLVTAVDLSFEQFCDGASHSLSGNLRAQANVLGR